MYRLTVLSLTLFAGVSTLIAQIGRGTITGIVHDPTGASAAAVAISAVNADTGVAFETTTNEGGAYTIGALPPGRYTVHFKASGFKEAIRQNISLDSGTIARVDPTLELGAVPTRFMVTAEAPLLETETAQNSESVSSESFLRSAAELRRRPQHGGVR